jgi:hypothetical protein
MENEFGHQSFIGAGVCIDTWGGGPYVISADGKAWRFEDSDMFGPVLVSRDGRILDRQPGEKSTFWRPHRSWVRQGRRVQADGVTCIWDEPRPSRYRRIARRTAELIEAGDEDGRIIWEVADNG